MLGPKQPDLGLLGRPDRARYVAKKTRQIVVAFPFVAVERRRSWRQELRWAIQREWTKLTQPRRSSREKLWRSWLPNTRPRTRCVDYVGLQSISRARCDHRRGGFLAHCNPFRAGRRSSRNRR